jgi:alcohol dehydrogenase class IV
MVCLCNVRVNKKCRPHFLRLLSCSSRFLLLAASTFVSLIPGTAVSVYLPSILFIETITMSVNFTFSTTKSILCELGSSARIGKLFKQMGCKQKQTLLVVTDQGIMNAKLAEKCVHGLTQEGFNVEVYSNVVADPPEGKILEALEVSKQKNAVGVIGFGGGSSMDVAKIVAFLAHQDCQQGLEDIYGVDQCRGGRLPLVQVPTTAGI